MRVETRQAHLSSVRAATRYLADTPAATLEDAAEVAGMAPYHFHRTFRRLTGLNVAAYQRRLRLMRAARALRAGRSVRESAALAGYRSPDGFRRAFRRQYGTSPRALQESPMSTPPLAAARLGLVKIPVRDLAVAAAFYRDVLGLPEDFAVEAYGWAQYGIGGAPLCLFVPGMGGGDREPGGETGVQLRVPDARAAYEQVSEHVEGELTEGDDGAVGFVISDPDGNLIQVIQCD